MPAPPTPTPRRSRRDSRPDDAAAPRLSPSQIPPCLTLSFGFPDSPRQAAQQKEAALADIHEPNAGLAIDVPFFNTSPVFWGRVGVGVERGSAGRRSLRCFLVLIIWPRGAPQVSKISPPRTPQFALLRRSRKDSFFYLADA